LPDVSSALGEAMALRCDGGSRTNFRMAGETMSPFSSVGEKSVSCSCTANQNLFVLLARLVHPRSGN
jgi:hypothetical protein